MAASAIEGRVVKAAAIEVRGFTLSLRIIGHRMEEGTDISVNIRK
jgi:hypothetical protein